MDEGLKRNLASGATWMRALHMVLFAIIFYVAEMVLIAVALIQLLFKLFSGSTLAQLDRFGAQLAAYMGALVAFLTFADETKPFPFGPWPAGAGREGERRGDEPVPPPGLLAE
jgi:hypothetical protein